MKNRVADVDFVAESEVWRLYTIIEMDYRKWMTTALAVAERLQEDLYISPGV